MRSELLFILPTYNHFDYAARCLQSFVRYTRIDNSFVAVVDDASDDWWKLDHVAQWSQCNRSLTHFHEHAGLTRSWNYGLRLARDTGLEYTICGNSDLLFTEGWYHPLKTALNSGYDLVGPVTNAPGHAPWQNINNFLTFDPTDDPARLDEYARQLCVEQPPVVHAKFINGFFLMAKTSVWWDNAFDKDNVFNPSQRLTGNESELQQRFTANGKNIGFVPRSFVFHYRSVSRPDALGCKSSNGAFRR